MAGEFLVMEKLYRLNHQPALTMGNAKSIDILVRTASGRLREISVKSICRTGKWGIGVDDVSRRSNLFFVLLDYGNFGDVTSAPDVFVLPARTADKLKLPWISGPAIYCDTKAHRARVEPFRDAWGLIG
jgi:hypothetical protein